MRIQFSCVQILERVGKAILWMIMNRGRRFSEFQKKWPGKIRGLKVHGEVEPLREYSEDEMMNRFDRNICMRI
jgi:hypothetical protein